MTVGSQKAVCLPQCSPGGIRPDKFRRLYSDRLYSIVVLSFLKSSTAGQEALTGNGVSFCGGDVMEGSMYHDHITSGRYAPALQRAVMCCAFVEAQFGLCYNAVSVRKSGLVESGLPA